MRRRKGGIWNRIHTCACGRHSRLTIYLSKIAPKNMCMKIQPKMRFFQCWKVIMPLFLPTDRQVQARPTPWRVHYITKEILREELSLDVWKKYSNLFNKLATRTPHSWSELLIFKYIMKTYQIY